MSMEFEHQLLADSSHSIAGPSLTQSKARTFSLSLPYHHLASRSGGTMALFCKCLAR